MEHITDPKIREIMAQLDGGSSGKPSGASEVSEPPKVPPVPPPPVTVEEFLKSEKLDEWPQRITSENVLDLSQERDLLGSKDDIVQQLKDATPLDMKLLKDLEDRLQNFEDNINRFGNEIFVGEGADRMSTKPESSLPLSVNKAFMTDLADLDILKVAPTSRSSRKKSFLESAQENRYKNVENCSFPGFRAGEMVQLPGQLEGPQLLHRVTKAQDFNPGFRKFWKKIFQSEASAAILQDAFWWIFIEKFEGDKREDQNKLFDRIADSFVALFTTVNPEIKDKVFAVYTDCLAQAIFAAFHEAFPDSERHFKDHFKQEIVNTVSEWVTGIKPPPGSWRKWDISRLEPKGMQRTHTTDMETQGAHGAPALLGTGQQSLDMEDFHRMIQKLGDDGNFNRQWTATGLQLTPQMSREVTRLTQMSGGTVGGSSLVPALPAISPSRQAFCGTPRVLPTESHQVGPGPELERVMFNTQGRSPLVSHYLRMRQLADRNQPVQKIRRTEVASLPSPERPTYREVINETMAKSDLLSQEYQKICDETAQEILKYERQQRDANKEIEQLKKEIQFCKNSAEIKAMSERILDKKDRERSLKLRPSTKGSKSTAKSSSTARSQDNGLVE